MVIKRDVGHTPRRDGRERLIAGARRLLAERGYAGMELRDVAATGEAPRGSIYHHFPGGKAELAAAAARREGEEVREGIERAVEELGVRGALARFGEMFRRRTAKRPDLAGCPVAAAAVADPENPELVAIAGESFRSWADPIAGALVDEGVDRRRAAGFAATVVATFEGALLMTRAANDPAPLDEAVTGLEASLDTLLGERSGHAGTLPG